MIHVNEWPLPLFRALSAMSIEEKRRKPTELAMTVVIVILVCLRPGVNEM